MIAETWMADDMVKDLARRVLYGCGALGLFHRLRNAHTLTVVMFHRTLDPADERWQSCDPDYTIARSTFRDCLAFFTRHYNVVSIGDVLAARRGSAGLPPRALLITFDDGWRDNVEFALPELAAAGLPALMFVVADAVGRRQPFYQERIVAAWRRGTLALADLEEAVAEGESPRVRGNGDGDGPPTAHEDMARLRQLVARLERLEPSRRQAVLDCLGPALDDGQRHMVDADDVARLERGGVAIGLHGRSHVPLTHAADLDAELGGARRALVDAVGPTTTVEPAMSFPHGAFDAAVAAAVSDAGFELAFTSVPVLNDTRRGLGLLVGRTGFETGTVVDAANRFRADWLGWYLFRRDIRRGV